jgi:hypothetical protein
MKRLVLHATDTAQWQALVHEAEAAAECSLSVETESYLVFMLMRFVGRARLAKTCLAVGYLAGLLQRGPLRRQGLRDVGDQCLLYTGLFPDHALRGAVPLGYYVDLGKSAYLHLSDEPSGDLFRQLSRAFVEMMDVLQCMRELDGKRRLGPLEAHALWLETGSRHALRTLRETTRNSPLPAPRLH